MLADCCSVALAPAWHLRPGCKWCCCSGRCSLLDFVPWLCYSCRHGSLGLHPAHAAHDVKRTPEPYCTACFTGDNCGVLHRALIPAEQGTWQVAYVTRSFQSFRRCCQICSTPQRCGPAASLQRVCERSVAMLSPGLRARMCTRQETHHRLLAEPTEREVYCSSLKEDEKLRGGLLMCQRPPNGKIPNQQGLVLKHQTLHWLRYCCLSLLQG